MVRTAIDTNNNAAVNSVFVLKLNHVSGESSLIGNIVHANMKWLVPMFAIQLRVTYFKVGVVSSEAKSQMKPPLPSELISRK